MPLPKKSVQWLLAKGHVDEGGINTISLLGDQKGHDYQGNGPFLLVPLWPSQSRIDNIVEGGCLVTVIVLHLLFLLWLLT